MQAANNKTDTPKAKIETQDVKPIFLQLKISKKKEQECKMGFGEWNKKQIFKFFLFVYHHRAKFLSKSSRKSNRIFKRMTKFIKSRTSSQCRTHYQNLIRKQGNMQKSLNKFIEQTPLFYQKYNHLKPTLEILEDNEFLDNHTQPIGPPPKIPDEVIGPAPKQPILKISQPSSSTSLQMSMFNSREFYDCMEQSMAYKQLVQLRSQKVIECQLLFESWLQKVSQLMMLRF